MKTTLLISSFIFLLSAQSLFSQETWTATSITNAPSARRSHSAVWTGTTMIIWGGLFATWFNTGGIYDPVAAAWTPTSVTNAPLAREVHTAVWTGSKMIIWGGYAAPNNLATNTGGIYDPVTDSWTTTSTVNAPTARAFQTAIWTGTKMIIWGGYTGTAYLNTGGVYDPVTDIWSTTSNVNAPTARSFHTAVWTGSKMIVWGAPVQLQT